MAIQVHLTDLREKLLHRFHGSAPLASRCNFSLSSNSRIRIGRPEALSEGIFYKTLEVMGPMPAYPLQKINRRCVLRCSSSSETHQTKVPESNQLVELPIFPLPLVLFPGATLPLQIFEFRYRMMMHTLLQGDLRLGFIYSDNSNGMVNVGCVGEVVRHEKLVDDRFFLICKGQERFRVINFVRTKPYMVAEVQWLEDRPSTNGQEGLESLALEVETFMSDVVRLSNKLNGKLEKEAKELRRNLFPTPFSFFVGSTFEGAPREQQALLELEDTAVRLKREKETLRNTLSYLAAASAVKEVFQSSSFNEN